jgi:zinc protease
VGMTMKKNIYIFLAIVIVLGYCIPSYARRTRGAEHKKDIVIESEKSSMENKKKSDAVLKNHVGQTAHVHKIVLDNGMTVLTRKVPDAGKVSIQLWYYVGSKDEGNGERGIAHLIEHMIFKGTEKLSESDINVITHKLSGNCNAFTSYDYTGYLFNLPTHNWHYSLEMMADCMENCTFKEDMLSSEMKAVIQELKMYKDIYVRSLVDEMIGMVFADHPYHHPIIGYKQDLWSVHSGDLKAFYKKHYKPNNATLVVVGNVEADDVFEQAKKYFEDIESDPDYKKEEFYFNQDISAKSITLYRDVQQPTVICAFVIPGSQAKKDHLGALASIIIGSGKSSRLYKKLVNELQLATSVSASAEDLFDHGLFFIAFEPRKVEDIDAIEKVIQQELITLAKEGFSDEELMRAVKQTKMGLYELLEDAESQATEIGKYFLATGDPDYVFNYLEYPVDQLHQQTHEYIKEYLRPVVMHKGQILPLPQSERAVWHALQELSDQEDNRILSARVRETEVEPAVYADTLTVTEPNSFDFPKPIKDTLSNGMKLLYHNNTNTPKIDVTIEFVARSYYDPQDKQGLYSFVASMMTEGTKKYSGQELADIIESRGMSLDVSAGSISLSMLSEDFEFGLFLLHEIVTAAAFDEKEIEKVRKQLLVRLKKFWDDPRSFSTQLVREKIYKGHPYSKNGLGTQESLQAITQQDLMNFYKIYITPHGATMAIVGDLTGYDVPAVVAKVFNGWQTKAVQEMEFPVLVDQQPVEIDYFINRDQAVLCFAGLSVARKNPDYDKLMLFDQIFGGGVLGSMSSRLFELREQTGLFYNISGSLVAGSNEQPGMVMVKTIVSLDRLKEAERVIKETIDTTIDTITPQEFAQAQDAVINSLIDNFSSNEKMINAFLFLERYHFPQNFFDTRAAALKKITLPEIQDAARKVLSSARLLTVRTGRLAEKNQK